VLGHRFSFLMARGADPKGLAQVEAAFAGGTDHGSEIRYRRKDGSMFWAAIFISPVRDEGGELVQAAVQVRRSQSLTAQHAIYQAADKGNAKTWVLIAVVAIATVIDRSRLSADIRPHNSVSRQMNVGFEKIGIAMVRRSSVL
jgi:hypothetical protein